MRFSLLAALLILGMISAGCISDLPDLSDEDEDTPADTGFAPHVIIGIPDTGINPYHEIYHRPNLTEHPSTYIEDFPEDTPALNLSVGGDDFDALFEADKEIWENIEEDTWYWIPQTVFVAVYCESGQSADHRGDYCILDDGHMHGTGTTSSALMENEDALFAFKAGGPGIGPFRDGGIPVDIFSVSWGSIVPIPVDLGNDNAPIYVLSAGNDPRPTAADAWAGDPRNIVVGGAYAEDNTQEALAGNQPDVVSYFCRPTADTQTATGMRDSYCGTSFSGPTVAGALSKVVYAVRESTGYTGSGIQDGYVDPLANFTVEDLREALERTASYDPEPKYPNTSDRGLPLNPAAPWMQWSWGFYDGDIANVTIDHVLGIEEAPEKPMEAQLWMDGVRTVKETLHG